MIGDLCCHSLQESLTGDIQWQCWNSPDQVIPAVPAVPACPSCPQDGSVTAGVQHRGMGSRASRGSGKIVGQEKTFKAKYASVLSRTVGNATKCNEWVEQHGQSEFGTAGLYWRYWSLMLSTKLSYGNRASSQASNHLTSHKPFTSYSGAPFLNFSRSSMLGTTVDSCIAYLTACIGCFFLWLVGLHLEAMPLASTTVRRCACWCLLPRCPKGEARGEINEMGMSQSVSNSSQIQGYSMVFTPKWSRSVQNIPTCVWDSNDCECWYVLVFTNLVNVSISCSKPNCGTTDPTVISYNDHGLKGSYW